MTSTIFDNLGTDHTGNECFNAQIAQILFIDSGVDNYPLLTQGVTPGTEVHILNPNDDGIEQITAILSSLTRPIEVIHLISHGSPGCLYLGNSTLELNNLEEYRQSLQQWSVEHLILYGCSVAAGDPGSEFLDKLHHYTHAKISANPLPTGNSALGGTWDLSSPVPSPLSPETTATYPHILGFDPPTNLQAGIGPFDVAIGDFNGDGIEDLAVTNFFGGDISIFLGEGDGSFAPAIILPVGNNPRSIAIGDFNGDGIQDFVVTNQRNTNLSIFLGTGDGSFGPPIPVQTFLPSFDVAIGDFNGDGIQDLAVINDYANNDILILLGAGDGSFGLPFNFEIGQQPFAVSVGDFNGDGIQDLAVTNYSGDNNQDSVSILLGNEVEGFGPPTNFQAGPEPTYLAIGDFNGDGVQDLVVANRYASTVSILLGEGDGSFGPPASFEVGNFPADVAVGDLNGDGIQDLVVVNRDSNNVSVLLGEGDGSFGPQTTFDVGNGSNLVAIGDFNGDGLPDLAVTNLNSNNVSILLNATPEVVSVTTPAADGSYGVGSQIAIAVTFNTPVTVDTSAGIPSLQLAGDTTNPLATYVDGSGTNTLIFNYVVQEGDNSEDLEYLSTTALRLNGSSIASIFDVAAVLTLPPLSSPESLGGSKDILIDTIPPTVTRITRATGVDERINATAVVYTVTFSEEVRNLDVSDFTLTTTDTVNGIITGVSATSGTTIEVTVSNITGEGTLRLDVPGTATINDSANNALTTAFNTGEIYRIDGEVDPVDGEVDPVEGEVDPVDGEVDPVDGEVDPVTGEPDNVGGGIPLLLADFGPTGPPTFKAFMDNLPLSISGIDASAFIADISGICDLNIPIPTLPTLASSLNGTDGDDVLIGSNESESISGIAGQNFLQGLGGNDQIVGGNGNDIIHGNQGDDFIDAGAGDDLVHGGQGNDFIVASQGNNEIYGDLGDDTLIGGTGNDFLNGNQGNDVILAGSGNNLVHGGQGDDTLVGGADDDVLFGDQGNDIICAGGGNNFLYGNQGNDTLIGGDGDDVLYGGQDDDLLIGGDGDDWLFGDLGNDILIGGAGSDRFVIRRGAGIDLIVDFTDGEDFIGLAQGLTFSDLTITQGDSGALILADDELLAILNGVDVAVLDSQDFFEVT